MWGRQEDAQPSKPPEVSNPGAPEPVPAPPPAVPSSSQPVSTPPAAGAHIGKSLKIKGEITGHGDLYVDGQVEGRITLEGNNLTVGPSGNVRAEVAAQSITILGHLEGNVRAEDRMEIRKTGSLEGDLVTARIAIEEDAIFRGSIDIVKTPSKATSSPTTSDAADRRKAAGQPSPVNR